MSNAPVSAAGRSRSGWLKTLHLWHWISSALCLMCMLMFSITGITLNHADQIEANPVVTDRHATVPAPVMGALRAAAAEAKPHLPPSLREWLASNWGVKPLESTAEWSSDELYLALPRPGGDAWVSIDLASGEAEYEITDRGWIAYLNDLHKGRKTGTAWNWFIDLFAVLCLLFSITGLLILKFHASNRPLTWPMVGLGMLAPVLLVLLFVH